jgi:bifunctional UDP-N-acetylglucosamine pyrophosphorylase/glucosamine-1-phosphate N-acetyltransferase
MTTIKACILAAGEGKRLAPLTETRPKPIIQIGGKPLLQHTIEMLKECGVTDILLVVGYLKEQIHACFKDGSELGVKLTYIEQIEFLGTAHATNLAKEFTGQDNLLLIYGDLFMDVGVFKKAIKSFTEKNIDGVITAINVEDPTKFGILKTSADGFLEEIIEKPSDNRYGSLANAGVYLFTSAIFDGIAATGKSSRGEYELTESIQRNIVKGLKHHVVDISEFYWSDVGHPWQLLDANQHILKKLAKDMVANEALPHLINHGAIIEPYVTIHGLLSIGKNSIIKSGCYIEGPVIIGENTIIGPNAYLRPFCSIGNDCKVGNACEIKSSILMDHTSIAHLSYFGDSIVGTHVNIGCGTITANVRLDKKEIIMDIKNTRVNTYKRKLGAIIGDHASLGIQVSIMPGKTIGSYSQVGAHSMVEKNIPPNTCFYMRQSEIEKSIK